LMITGRYQNVLKISSEMGGNFTHIKQVVVTSG
jgi:hypothetical protein